MDAEPSRGNVLILADDPASAKRLREWITVAGEHPLAVTGGERSLLESGSDETLDLVVTALDTTAPDAHALLERMLEGELFLGVPQIHLLRDSDLRARFASDALDHATLHDGPIPEPDEFRERVRLGAEIGRLRRALARSTIHDELTGGNNRRFFLVRLQQEFARARRHETELSVVLFDIDDLGAVNERLGMRAGDQVVRHVYELLARQLRHEDVAGRMGGASFGALLTAGSHRGAAVFANKIRSDTADTRVPLRSGPLHVTLSAGVSNFGPQRPIDGPERLLGAAERALREARSRGGNRVFIDESALHAEPRTVLVADRDAELLDLAEDLLSMEDLRVLRADSSCALLETLRFRVPDLLILDLGIAGTDGAGALLERIRELQPEAQLPLVGLAPPDAMPEGLARMGINRFLTKPFSVSLLRSIARDLLDRKTRAAKV